MLFIEELRLPARYLKTRGVPGTHDAARVLQGDELPSGRFDIVLFEGWCVGTPPEPEARLVEKGHAELMLELNSDHSMRRLVE